MIGERRMIIHDRPMTHKPDKSITFLEAFLKCGEVAMLLDGNITAINSYITWTIRVNISTSGHIAFRLVTIFSIGRYSFVAFNFIIARKSSISLIPSANRACSQLVFLCSQCFRVTRPNSKICNHLSSELCTMILTLFSTVIFPTRKSISETPDKVHRGLPCDSVLIVDFFNILYEKGISN
jgi:hypothetical protein